MRLVPTAVDQPGVCALTGDSAGPFVELDRPLGSEVAFGGTAYVTVRFAEQLARAVGYVDGDALQAALVREDQLERELDELREQHNALLAAVGTTLKHGAVVRKGIVDLRQPLNRRAGKRRG